MIGAAAVTPGCVRVFFVELNFDGFKIFIAPNQLCVPNAVAHRYDFGAVRAGAIAAHHIQKIAQFIAEKNARQLRRELQLLEQGLFQHGCFILGDDAVLGQTLGQFNGRFRWF